MNPPSEHKLGDQLCNLAHVGSERPRPYNDVSQNTKCQNYSDNLLICRLKDRLLKRHTAPVKLPGHRNGSNFVH